jgi:hypothetical protein
MVVESMENIRIVGTGLQHLVFYGLDPNIHGDELSSARIRQWFSIARSKQGTGHYRSILRIEMQLKRKTRAGLQTFCGKKRKSMAS